MANNNGFDNVDRKGFDYLLKLVISDDWGDLYSFVQTFIYKASSRSISGLGLGIRSRAPGFITCGFGVNLVFKNRQIYNFHEDKH